MTFGYFADLGEDNHSIMAIREDSSMLSATLLNHRQGNLARRPLVFICHDIGGLIVKRMLVQCSNKTAGSPFAPLLKSTKCVVFFATPHRGYKSLEKILTSVVEKLKRPFNGDSKKLTAAVKPGADELFAINDDFAGIGKTIPILNFYESVNSQTKSGPFVDRESAILHYENEEVMGLRSSHQDLVRFESVNDDVYEVVRDTIGRVIHSAITKETLVEEKLAFRKLLLNRLRHPLGEKRIDKIAEAQENTFEWIWSEQEPIKQWLSRERGLFWISGKPGSGKSTMMKKVFLDVEKQYVRTETMVVSFFFSNLGDKFGRTFEGLLRVILEKMLRQKSEIIDIILDNFPEAFENWASSEAEPSSEDLAFEIGTERLKRTVLDVVRRGPRNLKLVICVDALDECDDVNTKNIIAYFRQLVNETNQASVRICFSGRGIADALINTDEEREGFTMEDRTEQDIETFVSDEISAFPFPESEALALYRLRVAIVAKANGVFLWAVLVCRKLSDGCEQGDTLTELLGVLQTTPPELEGIFSSMLAGVEKTHLDETNLMLALMLTAVRPLEVRELCFAMALGSETIFNSQKTLQENSKFVLSGPTMMRRVRHRCSGLLEGVPVHFATGISPDLMWGSPFGTSNSAKDRTIIQFVHQTVKDFLVTRVNCDDGVLKAEDLLILGHKTLSRACLRYLVLPEVRDFTYFCSNSQSQSAKLKQIDESLPFAIYAAGGAFEHYEFTEEHKIAEIQELERLEVNGEEGFRTWYDLFQAMYAMSLDLDEVPALQVESSSLLQMAVGLGYVEYARKKFESGVEVNETIDGDLDQWLLRGIQSNSAPMVEMLLEKGANPNATNLYLNPLPAAIAYGNIAMVRLLLQYDADPLESGVFTSILEIAGAQHNWEMLELLLEQNCEVFSNSWVCQRALLHIALSKTAIGEEFDPKAVNVLTALIQRSSDFSLVPEASHESLLRLLGTYPDEITRALLDRDPSIVTKRSRHGVSAIHAVCSRSSVTTVRTLVDYGAEIHAEMNNGWTTIFSAIVNPDVNVLLYLLENNVDPNMASNSGQIALHQAAARSSKKHIMALLEAGSDLSAVDGRGATVCHYAMINSDPKEIFEELKCATMLNRFDRFGNSPLHWAAEWGLLSAVQVALEHGSDIAASNHDGMSVLHFAARNTEFDASDIVQLLIDRGNFVDITDDLVQTPLHHAFHVLGSDDDGTDNDNTDYNAIRMFYNGFPPTRFSAFVAGRIVKALIQNKASVNAQDACGNTSLHLACWRDAFDIVFQLLEAGADVKLQNSEGKSAIDMTADESIRRMIQRYVPESPKPERHSDSQRIPTRKKKGYIYKHYHWLGIFEDLGEL